MQLSAQKKLITVIVLTVIVCSILFTAVRLPGVAAATGISLVQGNARGTATSGDTVAATLTNTPTSGDWLVATVTYYSSNTPPVTGPPYYPSMSETGATWTEETWQWQYVGSPQLDEGTMLWYCHVTSSGYGTTVTCNFDVAITVAAVINVCEWSGISDVDQQYPNYGSGSNPNSGITAETSYINELCVASLSSEGGAQSSPTSMTGSTSATWTLLDGAAVTHSTYSVSNGYAYALVTAEGEYGVSDTSGSSNYWAGCIATFYSTTQPTPTPMPTLSPTPTPAPTPTGTPQPTPLDYWGTEYPTSGYDWELQTTVSNFTAQKIVPYALGWITGIMFKGSATGSGVGIIGLASSYNGAYTWSTTFSLSSLSSSWALQFYSVPSIMENRPVYVKIGIESGSGDIDIAGGQYGFNTNQGYYFYYVPGAGGDASNTWVQFGSSAYLYVGIQVASPSTQYSITTSIDAHSSILPTAAMQPCGSLVFASGDSETFYFTASQGWYVYGCQVDGSYVTLNPVSGLPVGSETYTSSGQLVNPVYSYTFTDITTTHSIQITSAPLNNYVANPNFVYGFNDWTEQGAVLTPSEYYQTTCVKLVYPGTMFQPGTPPWINQTIPNVPVQEITDFYVTANPMTGSADTALGVYISFADGHVYGDDWAYGNYGPTLYSNGTYGASDVIDLTEEIDTWEPTGAVIGIMIGSAAVPGEASEVYGVSILVDAPPLGGSSGAPSSGTGGKLPTTQPTPTPTSSTSSTSNSTNPIQKLWGGFVSTVSKLSSTLSSIWRKIPTLLQDLMTAFLVLMILLLFAAAANRRDKNKRTSRPRIRVMEKIGILPSSNFVKGNFSFFRHFMAKSRNSKRFE